MQTKVILGGHWCDLHGWLILSEKEQDITRALPFSDNSVDCIFTEHVIEHVPQERAIDFMRESHRSLKRGGVFRVVFPSLTQMLRFKVETEIDRTYVRNTFKGKYDEPGFKLEYLVSEMANNHGHQFLWCDDLMENALRSAGFRQVRKCDVGRGVNQDFCVERRCRGVYRGRDPQVDRSMGFIYDPESSVFEAIK